MGVFVRAVVYGFGFSLGTALFRKVQKQLGFEDPQQPQPQKPAPEPREADDGDGDAATVPA